MKISKNDEREFMQNALKQAYGFKQFREVLGTKLTADSTNNEGNADNPNRLDAEKDIVRAGSLQEPDNQSNNHAEDNSQTQPQNSQKLDLTKNSKKFAKKVLATNLIETSSSPTTNGGFDEATWGKLDVNNWQGSAQNGVYQLTGYTGDPIHIIVPNEADFEKAGKSTNGLQVGITRDTAYSLSSKGQTIAFSKTNNQKVKAIGTDWSHAFSADNVSLSKFDGSSLDVSNVTKMNKMFYETSISDLTSLANWNTSKVTEMDTMFTYDSISDLTPLKNWDTSKVEDMEEMFANNSISDLTPLKNWNTSKVEDMINMFRHNSISDLTPLANWDTSKVVVMTGMFGENPNIIDLKPIANWNISSINNNFAGFSNLFLGDTKLNLANVNNTPLMQGFLKEANALQGAVFITNNADLVKAITNKDLPNLTNTAKRTITFKLPHTESKTITQIINYKTIAPVQIDWSDPDSDSGEIVQTYPVQDSDWYLDTSKQNDAIIVNGQIHFKAVKIPHINGYKAHLVRKPFNPASFMVSFMAVPTENKPSIPVEEAPSKPSAPADNPNKPTDDLQQRVVTKLNSNDSGWTMPNAQPATYTIDVPIDNTIDLSDLVIAEPVHAQTRTQIRVNKRFKLSKKHSIKYLKHRKRVSKLFSKHYALM